MLDRNRDLVLTSDMVIDGDLVCRDIVCKGGLYTLEVIGEVHARNIDLFELECGGLVAQDVVAPGGVIAEGSAVKCEKLISTYLDVGDLIADKIIVTSESANRGEVYAWDVDVNELYCKKLYAGVVSAKKIRCKVLNADSVIRKY